MPKNSVPNRQAICEELMAAAQTDRDVVVLCSDSRGSASLTPFFDAFPEQAVEVGIAEQDLVGIAAGLASCGKKAWAASPASFVTTRSYEQAKVDCAYSRTNVKLVGISGGVSYGALGMSHHSAQDIAAMSAIPNMRVYLPSDRWQTRALVRALLADEQPAYLRVGRNAVEDVYTADDCPFEMDRATWLRRGTDVAIIACGELVAPAVAAADALAEAGVSASVLDMYCVKPLDEAAVVEAAQGARAVRRPGRRGGAGRGGTVPAPRAQPVAARRARDHRQLGRGLRALRPGRRRHRRRRARAARLVPSGGGLVPGTSPPPSTCI